MKTPAAPTTAGAQTPQQTPRREGQAAARRYRLPFGRQSWRGYQGAWQGAGTGSSIDFQDHRAYMPGDDPRYIHWAAYARSGQLTMKLYRAEVSPMVDLIIDVSPSMTFDPAKAARTDALAAFCIESADRAGAPSRVFVVCGRELRAVPVESVRAGNWRERLDLAQSTNAAHATVAELPIGAVWRAGALKVFVCDLLFPGDPSPLLSAMTNGGGTAVILAPALDSEAEPPERGNVELIDCESGVMRHQQIDDELARRYRDAYARHFELWREAARRSGATLARVPCEGNLVDALASEALTRGAVEITVR